MHASELTETDYTPPAQQGGDTPAPSFQDTAITRDNLLDGTLKTRFDTIAFPQLSVAYDGTDDDGNPVPETPVVCTGPSGRPA